MSIDHDIGPEYSQITENIYLGTSMCCREHADYHFKKLGELGIVADIDLRSENHDTPTNDIEAHMWLPIDDTFPPTMWQADVGIDFIKSCVDFGKKIYVHCEVGHGRSPTLVSAYFMREKGMNAVEAVEFVKSKRNVAHPTDKQLKFLQDFEDALKVKRN